MVKLDHVYDKETGDLIHSLLEWPKRDPLMGVDMCIRRVAVIPPENKTVYFQKGVDIAIPHYAMHCRVATLFRNFCKQQPYCGLPADSPSKRRREDSGPSDVHGLQGEDYGLPARDSSSSSKTHRNG